MVTAVDTNILLDVFLDDPVYQQSSFKALTVALAGGRVVVSDVVWAETGAAFPDMVQFEDIMRNLAISHEPTPVSASSKAAVLWRMAKSRKKDSPKRMVADFLVGAHALVCADCLLTRDHGFYRDYFEGLKVIDPTKPTGRVTRPA